MNAILFAAGNGMRLRPVTKNIQKCMLPVYGKPILEWWLNAVFASECFDKVFVNIHHMGNDVEWWIKAYCARTSRKINIIDERRALLGTAGTLFYHADPSEDFMTVYTDTFSSYAMHKLPVIVDRFKREPESVIAGLVSFDSPDDGSAGVMVVDREGIVLDFEEKARNGSKLAWAGIMFCRKDFLNYIKKDDKDIARDVFPRLKDKMKCIAHVDAYDIGRGIEHYERLNRKTY